MRNLLFVLVDTAAHWLLDDVLVFLPPAAVNGASKLLFGLTGNGYRFDEFLVFWNKKKPEAEK